MVLETPPVVVDRTEVEYHRVPTTDHQYQLLQEAIRRCVAWDPGTYGALNEQIQSNYQQLLGGAKHRVQPAMRTEAAGGKLGWRDKS